MPALSPQFSGLRFRGLDDDAAAEERPLSSALEATVANNHHFLHRLGGGSAIRLNGVIGLSGLSTENRFPLAALEGFYLINQPILLTVGMKFVRVYYHGRVGQGAGRVELQIDGVPQRASAEWATTGTNNALRTVSLELSAAVEVERWSTLRLIAYSQPEGTVLDLPKMAETRDGMLFTVGSNGLMSADAGTVRARAIRMNTATGEPLAVSETITDASVRYTGTTWKDLAGSSVAGDVAILNHKLTSIPALISEVNITAFVPRSIQIKTESV